MIHLHYNFLQWFKRYYFVYLFGFFIYFRPTDPFIYDILTATYRNITESQYKEEAYSISAGAAVIFSLFIFLFTSFMGIYYIFGISLFGAIALSTFVWRAETLEQLRVFEVFFGGLMATEIMYHASIYVCYDTNKNYLRLTSYIRAVPLASKMVSALLAQIIITQGWLNYEMLAFLGVPVSIQAAFVFLHLPLVFEDELTDGSKISWFKSQFKNTFDREHIPKWALWSALSLCGYAQVSIAMQHLWKETQLKNGEIIYNGAVEGILALVALVGVLVSGTIKTNWKFHNTILLLTSLLQGVLLFIIGSSENIWLFNVCYVIFGGVHHFITASLSAAIAVKVARRGTFTIVFSFIGLVAAVLNFIFVCIFYIGMNGLTVQTQFIVYGGYYVGVAMFVIFSWIVIRK